MTRTLALEIVPVRVDLIAAGFAGTPLLASLLGDEIGERRERLRTTPPIGRVVGPADIAVLAVHLSDRGQAGVADVTATRAASSKTTTAFVPAMWFASYR
jgi:NAD(P)-dependent dehydrogenase (short-subunit alcohol dehydrogenase family)